MTSEIEQNFLTKMKKYFKSITQSSNSHRWKVKFFKTSTRQDSERRAIKNKNTEKKKKKKKVNMICAAEMRMLR